MGPNYTDGPILISIDEKWFWDQSWCFWAKIQGSIGFFLKLTRARAENDPFGKIAFLSIKKGLKMVLMGFPDKNILVFEISSLKTGTFYKEKFK